MAKEEKGWKKDEKRDAGVEMGWQMDGKGMEGKIQGGKRDGKGMENGHRDGKRNEKGMERAGKGTQAVREGSVHPNTLNPGGFSWESGQERAPTAHPKPISHLQGYIAARNSSEFPKNQN